MNEYCIPVVVNGNQYTTCTVPAENEVKAIEAVLKLWPSSVLDEARQITVVRKPA